MTQSYLILVPVYNGEDTLLELHYRIKSLGLSDVLYVNDGSIDRTAEILRRNGLNHLWHSTNLGKGRALQTGVKYALHHGYNFVLTMDADLQHPPELIPRFLASMNENTIVLGCRHDFAKMPPHRLFSNMVTSMLLSIRTGTHIKDSQCGFRLFPTKILREISLSEPGFQFESEFLVKCLLKGYKIRNVLIPTLYGREKSAMRNLTDTTKFVVMYSKSFFW